jgi:hypothetical protein
MAVGFFSDTGDAVGSGDNGSMGRPTFGPSGQRVDILRHHPNPDELMLGATPLPEEALVDAIYERLSVEAIDVSDVAIEREMRDVTLRGRVRSAREAELVEIVARGTPGVVHVMNELVVGA